jgi:hypothetical protein
MLPADIDQSHIAVEGFWPDLACRTALTQQHLLAFKQELLVSSPATTFQLGLGLDFDYAIPKCFLLLLLLSDIFMWT